jgi:CDP-diacylglycerol--inositol 3-phosphatidyltransferase
MVLSREYPAYFYHCMALVLLDIASHWLQMYSQLLANKTSHKDVDTSAFVLLRWGGTTQRCDGEPRRPTPSFS